MPIDEAKGDIALVLKRSVIAKEVLLGLSNGNNTNEDMIKYSSRISDLNLLLITLSSTIIVCQICIGHHNCIKHLSKLNLLLSLLSHQLRP